MQNPPRQEYLPRSQFAGCDCQPGRTAAPGDAAGARTPPFYLNPLDDVRLFANQVGQGVQFVSRLTPATWLGIGVVALILLNRR